MDSQSLRGAILKSAQAEFLAHGFTGASLRVIAAGAGCTTGALYRHFADKAALFDVLVAPCFHEFIEIFRAYGELSIDAIGAGGEVWDWSASERNLLSMTEYIYTHLDAFRLLLIASEKTAYENFVHMMIDMEVEMTRRYMDAARGCGHAVREVADQEIHLFINAQFSAFFELVLHDIPLDTAMRYTRSIFRFFSAGWQQLIRSF